MDDHATDKKKLRRASHSRAAESSVERKKLDRELCQRFLDAFPPDATKSIAFFWPLARECDTRMIAETCHDMGMTCALPVVLPNSHGMIFRQWRRGGTVVKSRVGTMEPREDAPEVTPDIILVPLVMVDMKGTRLGRGAGYYDAALADLRARHDFLAIGMAYDWQISEDPIPSEPHDQRLDGLVTPTRVMLFA